jgi:hypothetical protein
MKILYNVLVLACAAIFGGVVLLSPSCMPDKCKTIVCANGGVCNDGVCNCVSGYTGTTCDTVCRDKFLGIWNVTETGTATGARSYSLKIEKDTFVTGVVIINMYNYFTPIKGIIHLDTIIIPNQQKQGHVVVGTGYITTSKLYGENGSITVSYEVTDTATELVDDFGVYTPLIHSSTPSVWAH